MTHDDDLDNVIARVLTDDHIERLLTATLDASDESDVPEVASLFSVLRGAMSTEETARSQRSLDAFTAAIRSSRPSTAPRRKTSRNKLLRGKAIAAFATASLLTGGAAAAAATGTLPDPVQSSLSKTLSHVGVDIPDPDQGNNIDQGPTTPVTPNAETHGDTDSDLAPTSTQPDDTSKATNPGNAANETNPDEPGRPDSRGKSNDAGKPDDTGKPDNVGRPDNPGDSANGGKPDDTGKPTTSVTRKR